MGNWLVNNGLSAFTLVSFNQKPARNYAKMAITQTVCLQVVWMGINIFLFVFFYIRYNSESQFIYTRHLIGVSPDTCTKYNKLSVDSAVTRWAKISFSLK